MSFLNETKQKRRETKTLPFDKRSLNIVLWILFGTRLEITVFFLASPQKQTILADEEEKKTHATKMAHIRWKSGIWKKREIKQKWKIVANGIVATKYAIESVCA